jgi:hypothetical protein
LDQVSGRNNHTIISLYPREKYNIWKGILRVREGAALLDHLGLVADVGSSACDDHNTY